MVLPTVIPIGYEGEYNARSYPLDVSSMLALYPDGVPVIMVQRPGENSVYPAVNTKLDEKNRLIWYFSAYDAEKKGTGKAQIEIVDADGHVLYKSGVISTRVSESLIGADETPEWYESYEQRIVNVAASAEQDANRAAESLKELEEKIAAGEFDVKSHILIYAPDETAGNMFINTNHDDAPISFDEMHDMVVNKMNVVIVRNGICYFPLKYDAIRVYFSALVMTDGKPVMRTLLFSPMSYDSNVESVDVLPSPSDITTINNKIEILLNAMTGYKVPAGRVWTTTNTGAAWTVPQSGVNDVKVNGTSAVNNHVVDLPIAGESLGLVKIPFGGVRGVNVQTDGKIGITPALFSDIDNRTHTDVPSDYHSRPITAGNLDYAVKAALTDQNAITYSDVEQFLAANRLGLGGVKTSIGDLSKLNTAAKNNLVAAINEAAQSGGGSGGSYDDIEIKNRVKAVEDTTTALSGDIAALQNTTETPAAAGQVWTSTADGAGWATPQGGGGGAEKPWNYASIATTEEMTQIVIPTNGGVISEIYSYGEVPAETNSELVIALAQSLNKNDVYYGSAMRGLTLTATNKYYAVYAYNPVGNMWIGRHAAANAQKTAFENFKTISVGNASRPHNTGDIVIQRGWGVDLLPVGTNVEVYWR